MQHKSYMTRWGHNQWRVSRWDESVQSYHESHSMNYWQARNAVGEANCPHANDGKCAIPSHAHLRASTLVPEKVFNAWAGSTTAEELVANGRANLLQQVTSLYNSGPEWRQDGIPEQITEAIWEYVTSNTPASGH